MPARTGTSALSARSRAECDTVVVVDFAHSCDA